MNTLIIYDNEGYIIDQRTGTYRVPVGIPFLEVKIPEGKYVTGVKVETKELILADIPKTQEQLNKEQIKSLGEQLTQEKFKNMQKDKTIDALGKELAQIKLQLIQK